MKELLTEFLALILSEKKVTNADGFTLDIPDTKPPEAKFSSGGRWYSDEKYTDYVGRMHKGKWIPATAAEKEQEKTVAGLVDKGVLRRGREGPERFMSGGAQQQPKEPSKPHSPEPPKKADVQTALEEPDEELNAKPKYDESDELQRSVVNAETPEEINAALSTLGEDEKARVYDGEEVFDKKTRKTIRKPKIGPGGLPASTGETLCTEAQTALVNGQYDGTKVREGEAFQKRHTQLSQQFAAMKPGKMKDKRQEYYEDIAMMHGLFDGQGNFDVATAIAMEAEAQVWVEEQDKIFKSTLVGSKFPNEEARTSWLRAAFHSAYSLKNNGPATWDRTKPSRVLKANARTDGAVQTLLERKRDQAKTSEERAHYEEQLEVFEKFQPYHDTYMVYTDEKGRTAVYHISNKKSSDLDDPHNNTTPKKRVALYVQAAREGGHTDSRGSALEIAKPIAQAENRARKRIEDNNSIVLDGKEGFTSIPSTDGQTGPSFSCEVMGALAQYLPGAGRKPTSGYYDDMVGNKKFALYLQQRGIDPAENPGEVMSAAIEFVKELQAADKPVPAPIFYFAFKVGQQAQAIYDRYDAGKSPEEIANSVGVPVEIVESLLVDENMRKMAKMKAGHASGMESAYTTFVSNLHEIDGTNPGDPEDNGPAVETFVRGTLSALHVDTYIRNYDEHIQVESGGVGTKPVDVRNCMAKLSGFKGKLDTPEDRERLLDHLSKRLEVEPGSDRMYLVSDQVGPDGQPKKIYIAQEMWRGAGKGQKVTSGFGEDLRRSLKQETASRLKARRK
jgi:hypothetical protein